MNYVKKKWKNIFGYYFLKSQLKPLWTSKYEDFVSKGFAGFLAELSLDRKIELSSVKIFEKQNAENKLLLFKNQNEILNWYKDSFLNEKFPI